MISELKVVPIPVLKDNYSYVICSVGSNQCIVVDPGESSPILDYLHQHSLHLHQIWITHFHSDHVGGVQSLVDVTHCEVLGPKEEESKIPSINLTVTDLDIIHFGPHKAKIFSVPGHTLGHVVYWFFEDDLLFSGDTLFSLGCGFLFEGTPQQMWNSIKRLRDLPGKTQVYFGHEYTQNNAIYAHSVDPENENLKFYSQEIDRKRLENLPTTPTTLQTEILTNPFLRADLPYWKKLLNLPEAAPDEIFAELRKRKDNFHPIP